MGAAGPSLKLPVLKPLPDENTDAGAMARLFIAEVAYPLNGDLQEARREMDLMRCVLENRLKHSKDFGADQYSTNISQIISASRGSVQFQGFENYPIIADQQKQNILEKQKAASGDAGYDQAGYINFINAATAAATSIPPVDPTPQGLYFWVTTGTALPSGQAVLWQSVGGNSFYTWNRPKPSHGHHEKHGHHKHASPFPGEATPQPCPQETLTQTMSPRRSTKYERPV